jgi:hypothetical protein
MHFVNKERYKICDWCDEVRITADCRRKLEDLEQYREFVWSYRPPM